MTSATEYVGIDVSLSTLDVYFNQKEACKKDQIYENNELGWQTLVEQLKDYHICIIEATGPYHLGLAHHLFSQGIKLCIVNPLRVKHFSRMQLRRAKTDKTDAQLLFQYGTLMQPVQWEPEADTLTEIRQLLSVNEQFIKQRVMLSNQKKALEKVPNHSDLAIAYLKEQIKELKQKVKEIHKKVEQLTAQEYGSLAENIRSIPGLGPKAVPVLILLSGGFQKFKSYKAFIAYVGLAPKTYESGKSVRGIAHICKLGSAYLRKILYQCSLSAKRFNPACKQLFERLRERGKPFKIAMIAVANKLIKIAFAIAKSGKAYDPNYAIAKLNK